MIFPLIVGSAIRMFPEAMPAPARLEVISSATVGSGVLLLTCSPPAPPEGLTRNGDTA
jgi:hypothetical protein